MNKRFILTILTLFVVGIAASIAIFMAKGYRIFPKGEELITGTGILSVSSLPDQANIYLDGHLTSATNANINSLLPKTYSVKIIKDGFIPWEKQVKIRQGLVTQVKASLYRSIATIYPLTYNGVEKVLLSPDEQKIVFIVKPDPKEDSLLAVKKGGIWVWQMQDRPIAFARGGEPHQIMQYSSSLDLSKASFRWSPDSSSLLVTLPDRNLLLNTNFLNDPPKDVTAVVNSTLKSWDEDQKLKQLARFDTITDSKLKKIASDAAILKWAPDESKILYSVDGKSNFKVSDLTLNKTYSMPDASFHTWLPDSEHLVLAEESYQRKENDLKLSKISITEYDGANKSEIYVGILDPRSIFVWPDGSKLVIISSQPTATASKPNLYGINLK